MTSETFTPQDRLGRPILTVGQLREVLEAFPPETHVVMADDEHDWVNVGGIGLPVVPDFDGDYLCVTFFQGVPFDGRQF